MIFRQLAQRLGLKNQPIATPVLGAAVVAILLVAMLISPTVHAEISAENQAKIEQNNKTLELHQKLAASYQKQIAALQKVNQFKKGETITLNYQVGYNIGTWKGVQKLAQLSQVKNEIKANEAQIESLKAQIAAQQEEDVALTEINAALAE